MKNKRTERKLRPSIGLTRHLIGGVLCLAVISLICSSAPAQNLFVRDSGVVGGSGAIYKLTPNGVRSIFASGLNGSDGGFYGLAFDKAGNLFATDSVSGNVTSGTIYKFTPAGVRSIFAVSYTHLRAH